MGNFWSELVNCGLYHTYLFFLKMDVVVEMLQIILDREVKCCLFRCSNFVMTQFKEAFIVKCS